MPISTTAIDPNTNTALHIERVFDATPEILGNEVVPVWGSIPQTHGTFKTATFSGAGTTTIVTPNDSGSLFITDIALFGDKVNAGTIELRFTDGTDTATLVLATVTDAPVNFSHAFVGRFQGWQDARIDLIVTNNVTGSATVGYMKVPKGIPFLEWDSLR